MFLCALVLCVLCVLCVLWRRRGKRWFCFDVVLSLGFWYVLCACYYQLLILEFGLVSIPGVNSYVLVVLFVGNVHSSTNQTWKKNIPLFLINHSSREPTLPLILLVCPQIDDVGGTRSEVWVEISIFRESDISNIWKIGLCPQIADICTNIGNLFFQT